MEIRKELKALSIHGNRTEARKLMADWLSKHGHESLVRDVLVPFLEDVGHDSDKAEEFPLALGFIAAKFADDAMSMAAEAVKQEKIEIPTKGSIVIGNIEDDYHALGRRIVVSFLKIDGWVVHDLGNDVLPGEFVDEAVKVGAKLIGASAMMYTTAKNIKKLRAEIDQRGFKNKIMLAVGGTVFCLRPELVEEVGGDGTARTALDASAMFDDLLLRSDREVVST